MLASDSPSVRQDDEGRVEAEREAKIEACSFDYAIVRVVPRVSARDAATVEVARVGRSA